MPNWGALVDKLILKLGMWVRKAIILAVLILGIGAVAAFLGIRIPYLTDAVWWVYAQVRSLFGG